MRHTAGSWHHGSAQTLDMRERHVPRVVGSGTVMELQWTSVDRKWNRWAAPSHSAKTERRFMSDRDPVQNIHDHERAIPAHCARTVPKPHPIEDLEVVGRAESAAPS
jgi:hypothetical protein